MKCAFRILSAARSISSGHERGNNIGMVEFVSVMNSPRFISTARFEMAFYAAAHTLYGNQITGIPIFVLLLLQRIAMYLAKSRSQRCILHREEWKRYGASEPSKSSMMHDSFPSPPLHPPPHRCALASCQSSLLRRVPFLRTFVSIFHPCDRDYVMDAANSIAECFKTIQPYDQTLDDRVALLKCAVIDIIIARIVRPTVFLSLSSWFVKEIKCRKNASCLFNAPLKSLIIFKKRGNICHLSVFQAS